MALDFGQHATSLKCSCCRTETMAKAIPEAGLLEVRDKRHGTGHVLALTLHDVVRIFDPLGTTYVRTTGSAR
mgnify:FL=1